MKRYFTYWNELINYEIDHEANCQAYANIVVGAALCVGLRFAGTADKQAIATLKSVVDYFLYVGVNDQYVAGFAGKATVESCATMSLLALSLVCAGTGNLQVLKVIRMMRSRIGTAHAQVVYGSHLAIHMALGFLFLGAGRFTLSRSPQAIAALVISLFPKFPHQSTDNRYHLQAFRHFYVLAIEPRLFLPRDIDSGKLSLCNLYCIDLSGTRHNLSMAPCILPELDTLKTVFIDDPNYWPVCFDRARNWPQLIKILASSGCVDIKQRAGCLSHLEDPDRLKSLPAQSLTTEQFSSWQIDPRSLLTFSSDRRIAALANRFIFPPHATQVDAVGEESAAERETAVMLTLQAYKCLTKDKMHALRVYVALLEAFKAVASSREPHAHIWQFKIISTIIAIFRCVNDEEFLLSYEFLRAFILRFKSCMEAKIGELKPVLRRFLVAEELEGLREEDTTVLSQLFTAAIYYDPPMGVKDVTKMENPLQAICKLRELNLGSETVEMLLKIVRD